MSGADARVVLPDGTQTARDAGLSAVSGPRAFTRMGAQALLESLPAAAIVVGRDGTLLAANQRAAEFLGHNPAASIGRPVEGAFLSFLQRARRQREAGEEPAFEQHFSGAWYLVHVFPLSVVGDEMHCVTATDVSARKAAEFEIRESEARLEEATRVAQLGTFKIMWDGGVIWSPHMYILHDVSTETFDPNSDYITLVHPEDRAQARQVLRNIMAGSAISGAEYRVLRRDKSERWIRVDGRVLFDAEGAPCGTFGVCQDITESKNREHELNDLLRRNATLYEALEASPIGVAVLTSEGEQPSFFYVNAEFQRLTFHNGFSLRSRPLDALRPADDNGSSWPAAVQALHASVSGSFELTCMRRDGSTFLAQLELAPVRDFPGRDAIAFVVNLRDITLDRQRADALLQSQKMEALGQLSGGVAHEINNLLQPVIALSELGLGSSAGDPEKVRRYFEVIAGSGRKARDVVRQILTFARRDTLDLASYTVAPLMSDALDLLQSSLSPGLTLKRRLLTGEARAVVNPTQVSQVVLNLVKNAADAMNGRGEVNVVFEDVMLDAAGAQSLGVSEGRWLKLTVSDRGCGMDAYTRSRVFEPFFTTKPAGKGTGLGLSVVYSIIASWGGTIRIESEVDQGTSAMVYIPADPAGAR